MLKDLKRDDDPSKSHRALGERKRRRPSDGFARPHDEAPLIQPVFLTASASIAKSSRLENSRAGFATVLDLDILDLDILDLDIPDFEAWGFDTTLSAGRSQAAANLGLRIGTETIFGLAVGGL
jgi:hypothetical protein